MYDIMVVDDDPTSLAICRAILEPEYNVALMHSGIQALGYMQKNTPPHLILLDCIMPGTNGIDVLKALKQNPRLSHIPVMFLTGNETEGDELEGVMLGAADYILKPVNPSLLKAKIAQQIDIISLRKENQHLKAKMRTLQTLIRQCTALISTD